ncbi:MAG: hypothetical protein ACOYLK_14255 [Sphingomonas sp.]
MRIGVPKEIKTLEFRVSMTVELAAQLVSEGHEVFVETNAGAGIGCYDEDYRAVGATISRLSAFRNADMASRRRKLGAAAVLPLSI